jgi:hypothetical protein
VFGPKHPGGEIDVDAEAYVCERSGRRSRVSASSYRWPMQRLSSDHFRAVRRVGSRRTSRRTWSQTRSTLASNFRICARLAVRIPPILKLKQCRPRTTAK